MGKLNQYEQGRNSGLELALRIVKDGGVEALERELEWRGRTGYNTGYSRKEIEEAIVPIKEQAVAVTFALILSCLHDYFGFGHIRCQRLKDAFDQEAEAAVICQDVDKWQNLIEAIEEVVKIPLSIPYMKGCSR